MNILRKLFPLLKKHPLIAMMEEDLDSDDQKTRVECTRGHYPRIVALHLRFTRDGRPFGICVGESWTSLHTEGNTSPGIGLLSHRVDNFRTPRGEFSRLLAKTDLRKREADERARREKRAVKFKEDMKKVASEVYESVK